MSDQSRFFDEMTGGAPHARGPYAQYNDWFQGEYLRDLQKKSAGAEGFSAAPASPSTSMARPMLMNA